VILLSALFPKVLLKRPSVKEAVTSRKEASEGPTLVILGSFPRGINGRESHKRPYEGLHSASG